MWTSFRSYTNWSQSARTQPEPPLSLGTCGQPSNAASTPKGPQTLAPGVWSPGCSSGSTPIVLQPPDGCGVSSG